ncbi:MAG: Smr/MutS family protein [Rickettsiales bacterium]|jgi:DNA-nicking Smr family endonuclease|nr:Smr/MutS family protein [Rickettsiales bacterium]
MINDDDDIWHQYTKGKVIIDEPYNEDNSDVPEIEQVILDLHHFTESNAFDVLCSAIEKAYKQKIPKMLIVTGLNIRDKKKTGILHKQLPRWLQYSKISEYIKDFSYSSKHEGALLVRLNKSYDQ